VSGNGRHVEREGESRQSVRSSRMRRPFHFSGVCRSRPARPELLDRCITRQSSVRVEAPRAVTRRCAVATSIAADECTAHIAQSQTNQSSTCRVAGAVAWCGGPCGPEIYATHISGLSRPVMHSALDSFVVWLLHYTTVLSPHSLQSVAEGRDLAIREVLVLLEALHDLVLLL
jgi:hypothetical protein